MQDLQQYGAWRARVASALQQYRSWAQAAGLLDTAVEQRVAHALNRLHDDRLSVAFVAEFSRGKSELINAIFFAGYGQRILPSSPGRTTMCPTELAWDPAYPPCIRLLPIETRAHRLSIADYRDEPGAWTTLPLDLESPEHMQQTFQQVCQTRRAFADEAQGYGLYDPDDADLSGDVDENGMVEIPLWRHALINFPHPLLKQGLVILDTPGLNAIGTEPELTLNLIPNAHVVLFILAAATGVTRSDIDIWRTHIGPGPGRIVVLNKIDALWDELRTPQENEEAIGRQQHDVAHLLGVERNQVVPVSAHKGLVGRVTGDAALFEKSRIGELEAALFDKLIPARQEILRRQLQQDLAALEAGQQALLNARLRDLVEQRQELESLRGKNQGVVAHMMRRVDMEKKEFDASLFKLQGTRAVFTKLSNEVYSAIGMNVVQTNADEVRAAMQNVRFATGMRAPVREFFDKARGALDESTSKISEIASMMETMYRRFSTEHGLNLTMPALVSLVRYREEIDGIEAIYQKQFGTATLLVTSRNTLLERFFDSIASRIKQSFRAVNADVEAWLKTVMGPLEAQIRQHREQLRHRQTSIQRIHDATDDLEQKIAAFDTARQDIDLVRTRLAELSGAVTLALRAELADEAVLEAA